MTSITFSEERDEETCYGYCDDYQPHAVKRMFDYKKFKKMVHSMLDDRNHGKEEEVYFYHSDHLGSASWITDIGGEAVQHLQYLPFGERYIDQRMSGYNERFTFTGKEKDEETGYGYFGARYMDHELMTMWLSVDPLADKYPFASPYAYCVWNPVKLVDPDGNIVLPAQNSSPQFVEYLNQAKSHLYTNNSGGILQQLDMLPAIVYVNEISYDEALAGRVAFKKGNLTINWCPLSGIYTDENHILSPTTILNHEFDHALEYLTHPDQWRQDIKTNINNPYDNKEEERVITGSERETATNLGEVQPWQVTRASHSGAAIRVQSPTSTEVQPPYRINTPYKNLEIIEIE